MDSLAAAEAAHLERVQRNRPYMTALGFRLSEEMMPEDRSFRREGASAQEMVDGLAAGTRRMRDETAPSEMAMEEILAASPWLGDAVEAFWRAHPFPRKRSRPAQTLLDYWMAACSELFPPNEGEGVLGGELQQRFPASVPPTREDVAGSTWVAVAIQRIKPPEPPVAKVVSERPHCTIIFDEEGVGATLTCAEVARGKASLTLGADTSLDVHDGGIVHGQKCGAALRAAGCHRLRPAILTEALPASGLEVGDLMVCCHEFGHWGEGERVAYDPQPEFFVILYLKRAVRAPPRSPGNDPAPTYAPCDCRTLEDCRGVPAGPRGLHDADNTTGLLTHLRHAVVQTWSAFHDMFKGKMRPLQDDNHPDWQLYNANPVQLEAMRDLVRKYDRARGFYFFPRERWDEVCTYFLGALYVGPAAAGEEPPCARPEEWNEVWEGVDGLCEAFRRHGNAALRSRWYADLVISCAANFVAFCIFAETIEPADHMALAMGREPPRDRAALMRDPACCSHPHWPAAFERYCHFFRNGIYTNVASLAENLRVSAAETYELPADWLGPVDAPSAASLRMKELEEEAERSARRDCARCGAAGTSRCSRCRAVRYCSRECQRAHHPVHKHVCRPVVE